MLEKDFKLNNIDNLIIKNNTKYNKKFGKLIYIAKRRLFFNSYGIYNIFGLIIGIIFPILFILIDVYDKQLYILAIKIFFITNISTIISILINIFYKIEFYEYGLVNYGIFKNDRIDYKDINNIDFKYSHQLYRGREILLSHRKTKIIIKTNKKYSSFKVGTYFNYNQPNFISKKEDIHFELQMLMKEFEKSE